MTELPAVVRRADLDELRISRHKLDHQLRTRRWQRPYPGVYVTHSGPIDPDTRLVAALAFVGPGAALSGPHALRRHGIRYGPRPDVPLVLVPAPAGCRGAPGLRVRPTTRPPADGRVIAGIVVAPATRAVVDTCLELRNLGTIRAVVSDAVGRGCCTAAALEAELAAAGRRGSAPLRRALLDIGAGARSAPECEMADLLTAAGLGPFVVNHDVWDPVGGWLGCCDVLWERLRAALEVDSREYHSDLLDWEQTVRRHNRLEQCGYVVLHVLPSDIRDRPTAVVHQVRQWLTRRANDLGLPTRDDHADGPVRTGPSA